MQCKQDLKSTWKLIKSLLNQPDRKPLPNTFVKNGVNIDGYNNIANELNS